MRPLTCLLADDEPPARSLLAELITAHSQLELVGEACDGPTTLVALAERRPELVFLDIHMPGLDGLRVVRALPHGYQPQVVFVTAHAGHAVEAFAVNALDYLLKPLSAAALERAVVRAIGTRTSAAPTTTTSNKPEPLERIALRAGERVILQRVESIERFVAEGKYVQVHVPGQPPRRIRQTMHGLVARLDPRHFVRVSRSVIVNLDHVRELQTWVHGEWLVVMGSGAEVATTRSFRAPIDALLGRR